MNEIQAKIIGSVIFFFAVCAGIIVTGVAGVEAVTYAIKRSEDKSIEIVCVTPTPGEVLIIDSTTNRFKQGVKLSGKSFTTIESTTVKLGELQESKAHCWINE